MKLSYRKWKSKRLRSHSQSHTHTHMAYVSSYGQKCSWLYLPKCPSVSISGWLGPCSENNLNDPELIPMPQGLAGLLGVPTLPVLPTQLGSQYIHSFLTICLLFTFPALLGSVPSHPDLSSLPWSILKQKKDINGKFGEIWIKSAV